jgi:caffeoyl-CoA O-methyltransferase
MNFLDKQLNEYINQHTTAETQILRELVRRSSDELEHTDMLSGSQVGQLLKLLVRIGGYKRILEVGTFTGYSAIWMADALPADGELITLEMNEHYKSISDEFLSRPPYNQKISQVMGPALETMDDLTGSFDMIFIDADKVQYPDYFKKLKPKLRSGGLFAIDNVLWGGMVLAPGDPKSRAVDQLNRMIHRDADFENIILPVRDGIMIAVKIK